MKSVFELRVVLISFLLLASGSISLAQNRSFYTALDLQQCRTIKTETTGSPTANSDARIAAADNSATKPCLKKQ